MNSPRRGRPLTVVLGALILGTLGLGMGTCGTDPSPMAGTDIGQIDDGFSATVAQGGPTTTIPTPTNDPTSCGSTGTCACEEGYEPDGQGNCVPIPDAPPPPPSDPGTPSPPPGPGTPPPPPAVTTWSDVLAEIDAPGCGAHGCHHGSQPQSMAAWQSYTPSVIAGTWSHFGGAPGPPGPPSLVAIFQSWQAGGFQP